MYMQIALMAHFVDVTVSLLEHCQVRIKILCSRLVHNKTTKMQTQKKYFYSLEISAPPSGHLHPAVCNCWPTIWVFSAPLSKAGFSWWEAWGPWWEAWAQWRIWDFRKGLAIELQGFKNWGVWWETPCWWKAWGPGPPPLPPKSGPAFKWCLAGRLIDRDSPNDTDTVLCI